MATATQERASGDGGSAPPTIFETPCPICHAPMAKFDGDGFECACGFRSEPSHRNGHRKPADSSPAGQVSVGVSTALDAVDEVKRRSGHAVRYRVRAAWGCGMVETKLYRSRKAIEREVVRLTKANHHYTKVPVVGSGDDKHKGYQADVAEVTVDGWALITPELVYELTARECLCCGVPFTPARANQVYIDRAHKQRAYRSRSI